MHQLSLKRIFKSDHQQLLQAAEILNAFHLITSHAEKAKVNASILQISFMKSFAARALLQAFTVCVIYHQFQT